MADSILQNRCSTTELTRLHGRASSVTARSQAIGALAPIKKPRTGGAGLELNAGRLCASRLPSDYIWVMSRSLVSGRKMRPTTKLTAATTIGYQRPE